MDDNGGGWLWFVVDVIFVALLALGMIYGTLQWRSRRQSAVSDRERDRATRENYREEAEKERRKPAA
jgi:hypothetical protein